MALIACPECGREKVSDSAEMCPECGFGVKIHFERIRLEEEKELRRQAIEKEHEMQLKNRMNKIKMPEKPENKMESNERFLVGFGVVALIIGLLSVDNAIICIFSLACGIGIIAVGFKQKNDDYQRKVKEYNLAVRNFEEYQRKKIHQEDMATARYVAERMNAPKCPMCQSINIEKISTTSRVISVAAVGVASDKIGKQYKCKNCKYMW